MPYVYDVAFDVAFRKVNDWCVNNGMAAGFPNFHMRDPYGGGDRFYGVIALPDYAVDWADVLASDMGNPNPSDYRVRLTAAHDYARAQGYAHGYPNFHQADYGDGLVYGTFFIKEEIVEYQNVFTIDLGIKNPTNNVTLDHWFRAVNDYAVKQGFDTGMPNGHWGQNEWGEWVIGVYLFARGTALANYPTWRELGYPRPPKPPYTPPPPPDVEVPRVIDMEHFDASEAIERVGLKPTFWNSTNIYDWSKLRVGYQKPLSGTLAKQGSVVNCTMEEKGADE